MDFHRMKRKELQGLCKKHRVPANLTNREMADHLASIFKENQDPVSLEELSSIPKERCSEDKANAVKKKVKKVRFSPDDQTIEDEDSGYQQLKRRSRRQTLSNNPVQVLKNAVSEDIKKFEGCQSRVTRSRVQNAVEEEINTVSYPPVGRKRGRGCKKNKAAEVLNIGDTEGLELGLKEDVKNGHDKVTSELSGRQLRSRKNVTREDSKKKRNGKGGDKVKLLDESSEDKNGPKQLKRNARKGDQCVAFSSDVEKVEVVSRVTRLSRAQSKDVASMFKNEVKIVEVKDGNETEKLLRRTKHNSEKDYAKSATSVKSDTRVTKVQEQSERDIALVEPPECLRRRSSRRKSVVSQSYKGANKEEFLKEETRKRSRTTELEAIVENSSEVERDMHVVTSQQQAPLRSRRKTVVLIASAFDMANKEDIGGMEHLRSRLLGKGSNEELDAIVEDSSEAERVKYAVTSQHQAPSRRSRRKTVILASPAVKFANKEDTARGEHLRAPLKEGQTSVAESDQGAKQQKQGPILEEEETSARERHPVTQKPQRKSRRITYISASVAPPNATAKDTEKKKQSKSRMETVEEEAAPTESLPSPEELPAGKDALFAVSECAGNKNNLDLDVSEQVVKSCDACSNKSRKKLRRNSGAKKQCGFEPPFLNKEEDKDSAGNMEENLNESYVQLVGPSTDQEMKQNAQKPVALYEKENDLVEEDVEKLVKGGNIESEVNCMSNRTVKTTCVFEDANWLDPKRLNCESKCSHGTDSSLITFPAESHGNEVSGQEMMVEFESNVINMDELTSRDNGLPFADKKYLTAATSTFLHSEKEWGTELPGGENTNFTINNVAAAYSRTPFGEAQIVMELKETNVTAAESVKEEVSELNKSSESTGLKCELENFLKKAEKMIANDVSNREGIPHIESSVEAAENQESSVQSHSTTAETDAQKIFEVMQSSYSDTVAPGTPFGPAPVKDECRVEVANAARSGMSDQERSEDPNPGTESCIHESVLMNEENTGLVKNAEKIRIHEDYFESKSSPSVNRTGVIDDSNLVESRTVGFESSGNKVLSPEIASLAVVFSSASRGGHAGRTSSSIELRKVLEIQEPSENMNLINYNMDDEGIRNPVVEDRIEGKLENANMTIVNSVEEVIFNDILKELGKSIVLKKRSEIPLKTSEKMSATMFSNGEGIILAESSVKAEKQEYRTEIDVVAATSGTPNTTEIKCRSSSDTATRGTSVGLTPQSQVQDKLCSAEVTVSITGSEMCNQDEFINLIEDAKEKRLQDDIIKGEIKNLPFPPLNKTGSLDDALVEVASNATKVVSSGMTYLAEFYTSVNQKKIAGETSNELKPEKVLNLEESLNTENVNYRLDKTEVKEDTGLAREDQSSVHSEDTNVTAAVPVQEVVTWESDKTEVKEDTGLPQGDQSSVHSEDTNITAAEPIQEVVFWESDKIEVDEDTSLAKEDQSYMQLEDTNITAAEPVQEVVIWESDKIEDKEDTSPVQEDQSSLQLEHTNITAAEPVQETVSRESVKMEVKEDTYQEDPCSLHLEDTNITAAEPVQEVVSWESDKIEVDEDISLAQEDQSSIQSEDTNINAAGAVQEIVFWKSDKMEVKEDTSLTQEGKSLMHLEDTNQTAVEPIQEVVFWDHLNKVCESGGTKESGDYLKKTEETGTSDSSGIGMVQTESSVETDEMSETTGQTTTIAMQWSLSSHDKDFISPLRTQVVSQGYQGTTYRAETDVSSAGCAMPDQLNIEENAKIVENEDTIKSETVLFVSGKNINDQSSEGKSREDGVYHPVSDCIDCQCAIVKKMDISDGNFNDVSGEIEEKLTIEVFDGEVAGLVSPEEKDIWNEKLPNNSFQHAINDMQEKSEAICMDTIDGIPVNILPQLALEQLDNESEISKQAFGNGTQTLPSDERTTPITSESFSMSPLDHALVDREMNASGERVVCHPVIKDFAATMDGNGISMSGETDVVQEDNMVEQIATSPLKAELTDYGGGNVDAELHEPNMSVTDPIFQETDTFGVPSTEYPGEISNVPAAMEAENYGVHDDQGEEVGLEHDCSSSFGVDGLTSTAGLDVDNIPVVFPLESTSNSSYPQSGTKVDDLEIIDSDAAKQFDTAFTIEEARVEDGEKSLVSHQRSLHGEQEDVSSTDDTPCSKLEISIEEEHPQAMDDINGVVGTDISTECKVTREEIDGRQISSGGFNDVTDGSFEDESKIGLEELVGAKADDCDGSMKTDTDRDDIDNSDVNLETEEPNAFHFPETIARESREIESCSKLNIVSSMKPEMVVDCSSDERKHLENPDESNIFTNMDTRLLFGIEDDVKNSDAKADDSNDVALDMTVTKCNSREGDYTSKSDVEDTYLSVRKDGPEDTEETMGLRNDFLGLDAAMVDKSPFLNSSETAKVADGEKVAFRTELNFLNVSVKMERSNSVPVKHLISSAMQSKSKPGLIQRTPKRPIFHDMKENEGSTKREQIGYRTTSKKSSKLRPPLQRI